MRTHQGVGLLLWEVTPFGRDGTSPSAFRFRNYVDRGHKLGRPRPRSLSGTGAPFACRVSWTYAIARTGAPAALVHPSRLNPPPAGATSRCNCRVPGIGVV